ncbi:MAG: hypothetical protein ACOYMC_12560 [Pirellulales bacterium]
MAFTLITQGNFTSTGAGYTIPVPSSADYFVTRNITKLATAPGAVTCVGGEWLINASYAQGDGLRHYKLAASNAIQSNNFSDATGGITAAGGFSYFPSPPVYPPVVGTAITNANPAVVTCNNTFSNGDRVRIIGTVGMQQISGMVFTISSVSPTGFTLLGLNASGFAAPATAVTVVKLAPFELLEPEAMFITNITKDFQAVVTVGIAYNYVLGQKVNFVVPAGNGMVQISGLTGIITAVAGTSVPVSGSPAVLSSYQFQVNINASAFTAFTFPVSASAPTTPLPATVSPAGSSTQLNPVTGVQTGYNFNFVPFHSGQFVPQMFLAGGILSPAGSANDLIVWQAFKMEAVNYV